MKWLILLVVFAVPCGLTLGQDELDDASYKLNACRGWGSEIEGRVRFAEVVGVFEYVRMRQEVYPRSGCTYRQQRCTLRLLDLLAARDGKSVRSGETVDVYSNFLRVFTIDGVLVEPAPGMRLLAALGRPQPERRYRDTIAASLPGLYRAFLLDGAGILFRDEAMFWLEVAPGIHNGHDVPRIKTRVLEQLTSPHRFLRKQAWAAVESDSLQCTVGTDKTLHHHPVLSQVTLEEAERIWKLAEADPEEDDLSWLRWLSVHSEFDVRPILTRIVETRCDRTSWIFYHAYDESRFEGQVESVLATISKRWGLEWFAKLIESRARPHRWMMVLAGLGWQPARDYCRSVLRRPHIPEFEQSLGRASGWPWALDVLREAPARCKSKELADRVRQNLEHLEGVVANLRRTAKPPR
ncbi:MAG: hypothetical protein HY814_09495 [Candidatus Riflebacteria bacterium]|nr:hypothetical protein [Candidatus Riflebacteria bacterium]